MQGNNTILDNSTVLVTGAAGFIGSNLVMRLFRSCHGIKIIGMDSLTDFYDVRLKHARLESIAAMGGNWEFVQASIADRDAVEAVFSQNDIRLVVNLAAQANVRYGLANPDVYIESNIIGFYNILEACRHHGVEHLVYASSSSVYGNSSNVPYSVDDRADNPVSLYAATKRSNELMAHAYSKLYDIPCTGLRFFTVYGPAGRPDMAYFLFAESWAKGDSVKLFNYGNCMRDFTYIDDIVEGISRVMRCAPRRVKGDDGLPVAPYSLYNIGKGSPENMMDFVRILKEELVTSGVLPADFNLDTHLELCPMQPGDVPFTFADSSALEADFGYKPSTSLRDGLKAFAQWYAKYYGN